MLLSSHFNDEIHVKPAAFNKSFYIYKHRKLASMNLITIIITGVYDANIGK